MLYALVALGDIAERDISTYFSVQPAPGMYLSDIITGRNFQRKFLSRSRNITTVGMDVPQRGVQSFVDIITRRPLGFSQSGLALVPRTLLCILYRCTPTHPPTVQSNFSRNSLKASSLALLPLSLLHARLSGTLITRRYVQRAPR